jgi:hypothetical protein
VALPWRPPARRLDEARPFEEPGHALTGDRTSSAAKKRRKLGYDVVHALVDDHSRLAYAEVLPDTKAETVTAFVQRGLPSSPSTGSRPNVC